MAKRLRQHINPLKATSLIPRSPLELRDKNCPLEVELGCGDGLFLVRRAEQDHQRHFIGLDIRQDFLRPGLEAIAAAQLPNVQLETCNFLVDLAHLFPPSRIAAFWINFPDPWFKRRHHNRRWLSPETVNELYHALEPGGAIYYQSDVWEPAIEALGLLETHPGLRNVCGELSFCREPLIRVRTSREEQCVELGRKIWRLHYRRHVELQRLTA